MPERPSQPVERSCREVARLEEIQTAQGRVWRFVSTNESVADHAWLQRERLLQISNGAAAIEICWESADGSGTSVELSHSPQLPALRSFG